MRRLRYATLFVPDIKNLQLDLLYNIFLISMGFAHNAIRFVAPLAPNPIEYHISFNFSSPISYWFYRCDVC